MSCFEQLKPRKAKSHLSHPARFMNKSSLPLFLTYFLDHFFISNAFFFMPRM